MKQQISSIRNRLQTLGGVKRNLIIWSAFGLPIVIGLLYMFQYRVSAAGSESSTPALQSDIDIVANNFRKEGEQLLVDVCFRLPSAGDWILIDPELEINGQRILYSRSELNNSDFKLITNAQRCDTVTFSVPNETDFSQFSIIVNKIETTIPEVPDCDKAQRKLVEMKSDIEIMCVLSKDHGYGYDIMKKPDKITDAELYTKVKNAFTDEVSGPWILSGSLDTR